MLRRQRCLIALLALGASGAKADTLPPEIPSFEGRMLLNWADSEDNKVLRRFLETNEGRPVFLELEIDTSVSTEDQMETMERCGLDLDKMSQDQGYLFKRRLGFPERFDGQNSCWNWIWIDSNRRSLPQNGASTGIVWYNLDGFFFVRGETHGDNLQSFNLRELDADAATWARVTSP